MVGHIQLFSPRQNSLCGFLREQEIPWASVNLSKGLFPTWDVDKL